MTQGNISQSQYVAITSGVGGASAATEKELIARCLSNNPKLGADTVWEFDLNGVGSFFGPETPEYKYASKYFGFISKSIRQPKKIGFYRSTLTALAPFIYPTQKVAPLGDLKNITDGSFSLSLGGLTYEITELDFSTAADYAGVAEAIQTKIQAQTEGGALWTGATVTFNQVDTTISLVAGEAGEAIIVAPTAAATGTDITGLLGWASNKSPIVSQGKNAESMTEILAKSLNLSNNFGSFVPLIDLSTEQIVEAAEYTHAQNVQFQYIQRVLPDQVDELQSKVSGFSGVALVYDLYDDNSYPHALAAAIWAAADYNAVNGAPGAEFQKDDTIPASVFDDATYTKLVSLGVNFIGRTQQAGQPISFYQPGYLQGAIEDQGVYMNEVWLKDKVATAVLNTQMAIEKWPAGEDGLTLFDNITQPIRSLAKTNGVVEIGKPLTDTQKVYISQLTGDNKAWQQVQSQGDHITSEIVVKNINKKTVYVLEYTYVYAKGDQVRKVEGRQILI